MTQYTILRRAHTKEVNRGRTGNANLRKAMHHFQGSSPTKSPNLKEGWGRTIYDVANPRTKIAYEIKCIRQGRATVTGLSPETLGRIAAVSTRYRNSSK